MKLADMPLLPLDGTPYDHKIVVAMSGGVDSSVVACLLHAQGYQVIGITLQLYDHGAVIEKKGACCAGQDIYDAKNVAQTMGFAHYVLNYENKFKETVIDNFVDTYLSGATPIPCVQCNMEVKFKDLLASARQFGATRMATGHYIQKKQGLVKNELHQGIDNNRDQSYFLYGTTQEQLDFLEFPLGHLHKSQTRALAEYFGLAIHDKPDSQDICFVPEGRYTDVIQKHRPNSMVAGDIYHIDGTLLGTHRGIIHYTIGQRRGLGLAGGTEDPLFVIRLDAENNRVYVGPERALLQKEVLVGNLNWIGDTPFDEQEKEILVKFRSMRPPVPAKLLIKNTSDNTKMARILLYTPEKAIAKGQAAVFYENDDQASRLLGGGEIINSIAFET